MVVPIFLNCFSQLAPNNNNIAVVSAPVPEVNLTAISNEQPKPVKRPFGNRRKRSFLEDSETEED